MQKELQPVFRWLDKNTVCFQILEADWVIAAMEKYPDENIYFHLV